MADKPNDFQKDRKPLCFTNKEFKPKPSKHMCDSSPHFANLGGLMYARADPTYRFSNEFPRLQSYCDFKKVQATFPSLAEVNSATFDFTNYESYTFVILFFKHIEDAHKSLKYGLFSDDSRVNEQLSKLYKESEGKVVAFMGVEAESIVLGAARFTSDWVPDTEFSLWQDGQKRDGFFKIKWVFVKHLDLSFNHQRQNDQLIKDLPNGANLSVENGLLLMGLLDHFRFKAEKSIFSLFPALDQREDQMYDSKKPVSFEIKLQKKVRPKAVTSGDIFSSQNESSNSTAKDRQRYRQKETVSKQFGDASLNCGSEASFTSASDKKGQKISREGSDKVQLKEMKKKGKQGRRRVFLERKNDKIRRSDRGFVYVAKDVETNVDSLRKEDHIELSEGN